MPFFDRDKFTCSIELDTPHGGPGHYVQGGVISGRVDIIALSACDVRGVVLTYSVLEKGGMFNSMHHSEELGDIRDRMSTRTVADTHVLLLGSRTGKPITVAAGRYSYPFSLNLRHEDPPTVLPMILGHGTLCCKCCCACCGYVAPVAEVEHILGCEIIIPFSMFDKNDVFKTFTVLSVLRADQSRALATGGAVTTASQVKPALHFFNCCECLALFPISTSTSFTLSVPENIITLSSPNLLLRYFINGIIIETYTILIRRRVSMGKSHGHISRSRTSLILGEEVVFALRQQPKYAGGELAGVLELAYSPLFRRGLLAPSVITDRLEIEYELEVVPDYDGACAGLPRHDRAIIPIRICHDVAAVAVAADERGGNGLSPQSMFTSPPLPGSHYLPGNAVLGYPGEAINYAPGGSGEQWYGYVVPLGAEGAFRPAAPLTEQLQPPVWGIVLEQDRSHHPPTAAV